MTETEPRGAWYAEADAYERRLSLAHRIAAMVAVSAIVLTLVAVATGDSEEAVDEVVVGTTVVEPAVETTPSPAPSALPEAAAATPPDAGAAPLAGGSSRQAAVDLAGLPEIRSAADVAVANGEPVSMDDLPEITAPPPKRPAPTAVVTAAASSSEEAGGDSPPAAAPSAAAAAPPSTAAPTTTTTTRAPAPPTSAPPPPPSPAPAAPAPAAPVSADGVKQLIRDTWPDGSDEEMALKVAQRESGFRADAVSPTKCCLGIFQLHYEANKKLINGLGFNRDDLFDAAKNVQIAYVMWQRSGWGPWSQTAQ